jgi:uncharacterized SAM-binding protein YcdF (DUF218 family)
MIARFLSFLVLLYALGFVLFAVTPGEAAAAEVRTDSIIVLTGASGRIEHGVDVLADDKAKRLFISGVDPLVTKEDLIERLGRHGRLVRCCVDLGSEAVDTPSNAEESRRWLARRDYKSVRLVTSDWHMRRAGYEFSKVLGDRYEIVRDSVRSEPGFAVLFEEYNNYVLRRAAVWLDV